MHITKLLNHSAIRLMFIRYKDKELIQIWKVAWTHTKFKYKTNLSFNGSSQRSEKLNLGFWQEIR